MSAATHYGGSTRRPEGGRSSSGYASFRAGTSEVALERLAAVDPRSLLPMLVRDDLQGAEVARVADVVARATTLGHATIFATMRALLAHESAIVRETAVFNLAEARRPEDTETLVRLFRRHADPTTEPSAAVREAASDALMVLSG